MTKKQTISIIPPTVLVLVRVHNTTDPSAMVQFHYTLEFNARDVPNGVTEVIIDQSSVTELNDSAFQHCQSLRAVSLKVQVPAKVCGERTSTSTSTSNSVLKKIHRLAFSGCTSLQSVQLPSSLTEIGQGAFRFCTSLTTVTLPTSVEIIGEGAFAGCESLVSINLHQSSKHLKIGQAAFHGCKSLISISVPPNTNFLTREDHLRQTSRNSTRRAHNSGRGINYPPFEKCKILEQVIPSFNSNEKSANHDTIVTFLKTRFDELPLHQICANLNITLQKLQMAVHLIRLQEDKEQKLCRHSDGLGMTALHVLVCNPNITALMIRLLLDSFPHFDFVSKKAKNGMTPYELFLQHHHICTSVQAPSEALQNGLTMGLRWDRIEQILILSGNKYHTLGGRENALPPYLQAAVLSQCPLEVVFQLAMYSIDHLCASM